MPYRQTSLFIPDQSTIIVLEILDLLGFFLFFNLVKKKAINVKTIQNNSLQSIESAIINSENL